jgi:hypothetical protein
MKKLYTTVDLHNRSRLSRIPFFNTREKDLKWTKRVAIGVLVIYAICSSTTLMIARSYPESNISKAVRAMFFDVDPQIARKAVQTGNEIIDRFKAIIKSNDEIGYIKYGRHPIQDTMPKLSPLTYLGNGILATDSALTIGDYHEGDCALSDEQAVLHDKLLCHDSVSLSYEKAEKACEVKYNGQVADYHEYMKYILPSKKTTVKNQKHWTRQLRVDEGWLFDTNLRLILNPSKPDRFHFDEEDENYVFFCVVNISELSKTGKK